jgi:hypothetical protein
VAEADLLYTGRPIFTVQASGGFTLPPGQYWLAWNLAGQLPLYVPPVSITGQPATGDGLIWLANHWETLPDPPFSAPNYPKGLPFTLHGTTLGCAGLPAWLSVAPMTGTLGLGTQPVDFVFDATGLTVGTYTGAACLESDAGGGSLIRVPVSLDVNWRLWLPGIQR